MAGFYSIKLVLLICLLAIFNNKVYGQQQFQFSQYMYDMLVLNPAYAGADEALSLTFVNRSQWRDIEGSPATQMITGHSLFKNEHLGLGLTFLNDKIGVHKKFVALGSSSYHIQVSDHSHLSMGLQMGINHRRSEYSTLAGNSTHDPGLQGADISHTQLDFGLGVYYRSPKFEVGFSIPELRPEKLSFDDSTKTKINTTHYYLFSKYRFSINQQLDIEPSLLLKHLAGVPFSFDINTNFIFKKILILGLSYRKSESIDILVAANITPQFRIGYAYDHTIGAVKNISTRSHELMIGYLLKFSENKAVSPR